MFHKEKPDYNRHQYGFYTLDQLVPEDHFLRKIEAVINFNFFYDLVEDTYSCDNGRPSLDPVMLIKIPLIQCFYGIRSMRQTIKEIEVNNAYRWFLGLTLDDQVIKRLLSLNSCWIKTLPLFFLIPDRKERKGSYSLRILFTMSIMIVTFAPKIRR